MLSAFDETAFKDVKTLGRVLDLLHAHGVSPIVHTHKSARSVRYPDSLALLTPSVRKSAKTISSYHKIRQCGYPMLPDFFTCHRATAWLLAINGSTGCSAGSTPPCAPCALCSQSASFVGWAKQCVPTFFTCRLGKAELQCCCRAKARPIVNWGD